MDWMGQLGNVLQRYQGTDPLAQQDGVEDDFDVVARQAPPEALRGGLADAFRSEQTPPFPQMLGGMFGQAGGTQRAGMLNMLIRTLGPQILAAILSRRMAGGGGGSMGGATGGGGLGGILGDLMSGRKTEVTPEEAEQIDPHVVEDIAAEAEQRDPSIIDNVSDFYAKNPTLVKGIGAAALAFMMSRLAKGGPF